MKTTKTIYGTSLELLTDLYQLTMAYGYWKLGRIEEESVFNLFFRKGPFGSGYSVSAGLEYVTDFLDGLCFEDSDIEYLSQLVGNDGKVLFEKGFLDYLRTMKFELDIDAIPEGTVVFPHQPLIRVKGPLLQCQLIETPLLNMINFQTLIATKAARIVRATRGEAVLEFGLRRAQGIDGSLAASRAAYIGGCAATSNVLAGKIFGIPVKGTHAHSWIMSFDTEQEAFDAYADVMPNNCVFLVDTFDTIEGVKNAIKTAKTLRERGHEILGIRLDSGDLAYLSIESRKLLDEAGFPNAAIVASNDLNEQVINSLKEQGATISIWGVGTQLVTAHDQPALGGVYKLSAIRRLNGAWQYKVKLSEQAIKVSTPGILQIRRYKKGNEFIADMIWDEMLGIEDQKTVVDPMNPMHRKTLDDDLQYEDLLIPVFKAGKLVYDAPDLSDIRQRTLDQLNSLHSGILRPVNPHAYPAGLAENLQELKENLIKNARSPKN